jgi:hypothetical protein
MAPDISPIQDAIRTWIAVGQALVGSLGALAFVAHRFVARAELRPSLRAIWRRTSSGLAWNMRRANGCLWPL